jgi:hypothetical protein
MIQTINSDNTTQDTMFGPLLSIDERREDIKAYNAEGQYLLQYSRFSVLLGGGHYEQESKIETSSTYKYLDYPDFVIDPDIQLYEQDTRHSNLYLYSTISANPSLKGTVGLSADSFKKEKLKIDQLNPKLGISWQVLSQITLRAGALRTLKRSLVTNQTIEPTQVSGFNQFYDDPLATDAKRYGVGIDCSLTSNWFVGAEVTYSDLSVPILNSSTGDYLEEDWDEKIHRFYLCWLPTDQLAVSIDYRYEYTSRKPLNYDSLPIELHTHYLPVGVGYFHRSGLHAKIRGQYISQKVVEYVSFSPLTETQSDDFIIFDASIGYRFPGRMGSFSISATNLFDTDFSFLDGNYAYGTAESPYIRLERQVLAKVTLSF